MFRTNFLLTAAALAALLFFSSAHATDPSAYGALQGTSHAKAYFDVNIGIPEKLDTRLMLIEKTYSQLLAAGIKPDFVIGFRGKASDFVTKGDDYVFEEDLPVKNKIAERIGRLKKMGMTIEQCRIAAGLRGIDPADFLEEITLIENGYISMIGGFGQFSDTAAGLNGSGSSSGSSSSACFIGSLF